MLGQIDAPAASRALALLAVFERVGRGPPAATETLRRRDPREFAGLLIALLRDPIKYEVRPVGGPGSPGALFVEGKKAQRPAALRPARRAAIPSCPATSSATTITACRCFDRVTRPDSADRIGSPANGILDQMAPAISTVDHASCRRHRQGSRAGDVSQIGQTLESAVSDPRASLGNSRQRLQTSQQTRASSRPVRSATGSMFDDGNGRRDPDRPDDARGPEDGGRRPSSSSRTTSPRSRRTTTGVQRVERPGRPASSTRSPARTSARIARRGRAGGSTSSAMPISRPQEQPRPTVVENVPLAYQPQPVPDRACIDAVAGCHSR